MVLCHYTLLFFLILAAVYAQFFHSIYHFCYRKHLLEWCTTELYMFLCSVSKYKLPFTVCSITCMAYLKINWSKSAQIHTLKEIYKYDKRERSLLQWTISKQLKNVTPGLLFRINVLLPWLCVAWNGWRASTSVKT